MLTEPISRCLFNDAYKRHWPGFDSHRVSSAAESAGLKHAA
jgi:hypothetical protein